MAAEFEPHFTDESDIRRRTCGMPDTPYLSPITAMEQERSISSPGTTRLTPV